MDRTTSTTIIVVLIVLALLGMVLGWRARRRRQSGLTAPLPVPADVGPALISTEAFYAATTIAGEPLNRVTAPGLGFRARATVTVVPQGIVLGLAGSPEAFIPVADLRAVQRATWTIDRAVEPGGLVVIAWALGDTAVDSYFRLAETTDPTPLIDAISSLLGTSAGKATT